MSKYFTCIESDCKKEFELSDSEMDFFTRTIVDRETGEEVQMKLPKRCPECRDKKRLKKKAN